MPAARLALAAWLAALALAAGDEAVELRALQADDACEPGAGPACAAELLQRRARAGAAEALGDADGTAARAAEASEASRLAGGEAEAGAEGLASSSNVKVVYHQTSPTAGHSILRTGFRLGTAHAICGSAIYFSPSVKDTDIKAIGGRGYIIEATVDLGRVMWMGRDCDYHMNGARLNSMGYNSITLDRGHYQECIHTAHCREYVIYNPAQVLHTKGFYYKGWKHWWSKYAASPDLPPALVQRGIDDGNFTTDELVDMGILEPDLEFQ